MCLFIPCCPLFPLFCLLCVCIRWSITFLHYIFFLQKRKPTKNQIIPCKCISISCSMAFSQTLNAVFLLIKNVIFDKMVGTLSNVRNKKHQEPNTLIFNRWKRSELNLAFVLILCSVAESFSWSFTLWVTLTRSVSEVEDFRMFTR